MKKAILFFIFLFLLSGFNAFTSTDEIKRTIVIVPLYNLKKDKNNFYSNVIRDALKAKLQEKRMFNLVEFGEIDRKFKSNKIDLKLLNTDEKEAGNFAEMLKADVVIYGTFVVQNTKINISLTSYDIIFDKSIVTISATGGTGIEIFDFINFKIAKGLADKTSKKIDKIDKKLLEELEKRSMYVLEEEDQDIIQKLLNEKEKYKEVFVTISGEKFPLAIPRGYNVIIFVKDDPGSFKVRYNEEIFESTDFGLKIMVFENEIGIKREFQLFKDDKESVVFRYEQKKDSEITIKHVRFKKDKLKYSLLKNEKTFFIHSITWTGVSGLSLISTMAVMGVMLYYVDLYNNTPIEMPEEILEYQENVYTLFPVMLTLISITGAVIIPMIIFWAFYGYVKYFKKKSNDFSFDITNSHDSCKFSFSIKFL